MRRAPQKRGERLASSATRALVAATDAEEPFLQVLAHLACAEFDENARQEHFRHALRESRKVDSPPLASAVRAVISNEEQAGMLLSFVMKLRKDRDASEAALVVEVTAGRVRRGRLAVALSERELAVVLAIARSQNANARRRARRSDLARLRRVGWVARRPDVHAPPAPTPPRRQAPSRRRRTVIDCATEFWSIFRKSNCSCAVSRATIRSTNLPRFD